jgi:hypothetical protein
MYRVYAAAEVADTIERIADARREQWKPVYGDEWPDRHRTPDHRLSTGDVVELGGMRFAPHAVGAAESHADSYVTPGDLAFIGDLAFNGTHPYTADGHTGRWLAAPDTRFRSARRRQAVSGPRAPATPEWGRGRRGTAGYWENRVTYGSLHPLMTFDALGAAPLLAATPLLLVHGRTDAYCPPDLAKALHAAAAGPKELPQGDLRGEADVGGDPGGRPAGRVIRPWNRQADGSRFRCTGAALRRCGYGP